MTPNDNRFLTNRRLLLASAAALSACSSLAKPGAARPARSELEMANAKLVTDFCADWSKRDAEALIPYLANDFVYQMFEGRPDLIGIEAFRKEVGPFLTNLARVQWDILRTEVIGQLVINERVDHFIAPPGGRTMHFPIAGLFVVKNAKIVLWRDYSLPGGKPDVHVEKPAPAT
jgi:limonene-1,2-epoxide hydrolase